MKKAQTEKLRKETEEMLCEQTAKVFNLEYDCRRVQGTSTFEIFIPKVVNENNNYPNVLSAAGIRIELIETVTDDHHDEIGIYVLVEVTSFMN